MTPEIETNILMSASCFGAVFTPNRLSRAATRLIPQLPKRSSLKETLSHYSVQIYRSCTQDASVSPTVPTTLHPTWEDIKSACCGHVVQSIIPKKKPAIFTTRQALN